MSLCRAGEAILYCRRPVSRFRDVGAPPGFLLHEIQRLLDTDGTVFHGIEKFPPPYAVASASLQVGDIHDVEGRFDAGVCIEVVEHLTPAMLDGLIHGMAKASEPGALWLFNTGLPDYVRNEDPAYLDPLGRGHIISWSLAGLLPYFERHGFRLLAMPGRSFGFIVERLPADDVDFGPRIYRPLDEKPGAGATQSPALPGGVRDRAFLLLPGGQQRTHAMGAVVAGRPRARRRPAQVGEPVQVPRGLTVAIRDPHAVRMGHALSCASHALTGHPS